MWYSRLPHCIKRPVPYGRRNESRSFTWGRIIILFGVPMFVGALVTGMIASIFIGFITKSSKTKPDAAIGISFTAFLATGVILISLINSTTDLYHILFGNLLAVTHATFWSTVVVGLIVMILIITFYRPLMISTFDPIFSRMSGLNTTFYTISLCYCSHSLR